MQPLLIVNVKISENLYEKLIIYEENSIKKQIDLFSTKHQLSEKQKNELYKIVNKAINKK